MRNWGKHFGLMSLRTSAVNHEVWSALQAGTVTPLASGIGMDTSRFESLDWWDQITAKTAAVGLSLYRGVLVGRSAARMHGIATLGKDPLVEACFKGITRSPARTHWPKGVHYYSWVLPADQVFEQHGIRTTTLVRTVVDIARLYGVADGVVAFDSLLRQWPITKEEIAQKMRSMGRLPGLSVAKTCLELAREGVDSPLESLARLRIVQIPGVTDVQVQYPVPREDSPVPYRVDVLVNGWLVVETDGDVKYGDSVAVLTIKREREREKYLQNRGFRVIRVGWSEVVPGNDGEVKLVRLVRNALAAAA